MQTSLHTDKREELIANKFAYKQDNNFSNIQSVNHEKRKKINNLSILPTLVYPLH